MSPTSYERYDMAKQVQAPASDFDAAKFIAEKGSKSAAIRALLAAGNERKVVAKMLGLRYQHVRNVEITPIKKEQRRVEAPK